MNRRYFPFLQKIGMEERDGDVRFSTGSGNMAISCMHSALGHNYRNSSFILDVAVGQVPRSTDCISSFLKKSKENTRQFSPAISILLSKLIYAVIYENIC